MFSLVLSLVAALIAKCSFTGQPLALTSDFVYIRGWTYLDASLEERAYLDGRPTGDDGLAPPRQSLV